MKIRELKELLNNCIDDETEIFFLLEETFMSNKIERLEVSTIYDGDCDLLIDGTTDYERSDNHMEIIVRKW